MAAIDWPDYASRMRDRDRKKSEPLSIRAGATLLVAVVLVIAFAFSVGGGLVTFLVIVAVEEPCRFATDDAIKLYTAMAVAFGLIVSALLAFWNGSRERAATREQEHRARKVAARQSLIEKHIVAARLLAEDPKRIDEKEIAPKYVQVIVAVNQYAAEDPFVIGSQMQRLSRAWSDLMSAGGFTERGEEAPEWRDAVKEVDAAFVFALAAMKADTHHFLS